MSSPLNVALFPAQGRGQAPAKVAAASDKTWSKILLTVRSQETGPQETETYLESLRLWLTLGGVGSRTRRGAGAISPANREEAERLRLPLTVDELRELLSRTCKRREVPASLDAVFCLARTRRVYVGPLQPTGEKAQKKLLTVLKDVRQDRRSRWPEADAIRLKVNPRKKWARNPNPANAEQYLRAALGLPIVMHFKDDQPPDHQILAVQPDGQKWRKLERYASPVIVRPVRVWENSGDHFLPVAIITDCTLPREVRPLVTTDPKAEPRHSDIVRSFEIAGHADEVLRRIEAAFEENSDFHAL
jgi:CRISPR-associated protein Cmr1